MIFVTVGAQMPFDRLIRAVDDWTSSRGMVGKVFAQVGASIYQPKCLETAPFMDPSKFRARVEAAELIVAHAGMGSILTALEYSKPIIVMPRRAELGETRNNHQVATARRFVERHGVVAAFDEHELFKMLDQAEELPATLKIGSCASEDLISSVRTFINDKLMSPLAYDLEHGVRNVGNDHSERKKPSGF